MSYGFPRSPSAGFSVISNDELEAIHNATLDVLEKTGVKIPSEKCLHILHGIGCEIDDKKQIARIPAHVVRESLKRRKSTVRLGARDPRYNIDLDGRHVAVHSFGTAIFTLDLETGKRRGSVDDDIVNNGKIVSALDSLHIFWPCVASLDVPPHIRDLAAIKTALCSCEKHLVQGTGDTSAAHARYVIRMAAALCGGIDELRRNPIISSNHCPISPLGFRGGSIEAALEYAAAGIAVNFCSCPISGATGPVTLAGSLALANAEMLAGFALIQSAFPGAPFIYGDNVAPMDMRTCRRAVGSMENVLMEVVIGQLGRRYGLPTMVDMYSTANEPGGECLAEKSLFYLAYANADMIGGTGGIEDGKTFSFEQQVIDAELANMYNRLMQGIEVNDETLAIDLIDKVKKGTGEFLTQIHTRNHLRTENFIPSLLKRQMYDEWTKGGSKSIVDLAREKAKKIISEYSIKPLEKDVQQNIDTVLKQADKEFSQVT